MSMSFRKSYARQFPNRCAAASGSIVGMVVQTVAEVSERLGLTMRRVRQLIGTGEVSGEQHGKLWLIDADSVTRYEVRSVSRGRRLNVESAWAMLYALSGRDADFLAASTRTRLRRRLQEIDASTFADLVATRTRAHRFRAANAAKAQADLVGTGRAAAGLIVSDLLPDDRRVAGYVPAGIGIADYAKSHFMTPDVTGHDVLYENTAPGGGYTKPLPAVVAADLALSTDTRQCSAGLRALEGLLVEYRNRPARRTA